MKKHTIWTLRFATEARHQKYLYECAKRAWAGWETTILNPGKTCSRPDRFKPPMIMVD